MTRSLTLHTPDDWHVHLREDTLLLRTIPDTAHCFQRALVMPNLRSPVTTVEQALAYRSNILSVMEPCSRHFEPLMTLYLSDDTDAATIEAAKQCGHIYACKLYPAGVTSYSESGVTSLKQLYPVFDAMQEHDLVLCIHAEDNDPNVDIFAREESFIRKHLPPIIERFPRLRIVIEHISTQTAVTFVQAQHSGKIAATITAHHLLLNRNDLLSGGLRPHFYCFPILKCEEDQRALIAAATSGDPRFFLGTDSAPHSLPTKESSCGCAGIYTAHAALELYADVFNRADALNALPNFASRFGADFYQIAHNTEQLTLVQKPQLIAERLSFGTESVIPFRAGETLNWTLQYEQTHT